MATSTARKGAAKEDSDVSKEGAQHGVLHVPSVHVPRVRVPGGTAGHLLWWGGLAAVAAFGVVDWPVVALVAAGSWIAEQNAKAAQHPDGDRQADK
jgi:hypothetical protein